MTLLLALLSFNLPAHAQPSSADINFQLKYDECVRELREEYLKADHPASFFLHGHKLVIGEEKAVKLYSDRGVQVADGSSCAKENATVNDGLARLIDIIASEGVRAPLKSCNGLTGEKIEAALTRIHGLKRPGSTQVPASRSSSSK